MPSHYRVRLAGRLEHVVRGDYFFEVAMLIALFEHEVKAQFAALSASGKFRLQRNSAPPSNGKTKAKIG